MTRPTAWYPFYLFICPETPPKVLTIHGATSGRIDKGSKKSLPPPLQSRGSENIYTKFIVQYTQNDMKQNLVPPSDLHTFPLLTFSKWLMSAGGLVGGLSELGELQMRWSRSWAFWGVTWGRANVN